MSEKQIVLACELTSPLGPAGPLPPDLLAAYNAGLYCAEQAATLVFMAQHLLLDAGGIAGRVARMQQNALAGEPAVKAVQRQLNRFRSEPARLAYGKGELVVANAHQLGIDLGHKVCWECWFAADPLRLSEAHLDPSIRMDTAILTERFEQVREQLVSIAPLEVSALCAMMTLEADRAALERVERASVAGEVPLPVDSKRTRGEQFQEAVTRLHRLILSMRNSATQKPDSLLGKVGISRQVGRAALRELEALGLYHGFIRRKPLRYQGGQRSSVPER